MSYFINGFVDELTKEAKLTGGKALKGALVAAGLGSLGASLYQDKKDREFNQRVNAENNRRETAALFQKLEKRSGAGQAIKNKVKDLAIAGAIIGGVKGARHLADKPEKDMWKNTFEFEMNKDKQRRAQVKRFNEKAKKSGSNQRMRVEYAPDKKIDKMRKKYDTLK